MQNEMENRYVFCFMFFVLNFLMWEYFLVKKQQMEIMNEEVRKLLTLKPLQFTPEKFYSFSHQVL